MSTSAPLMLALTLAGGVVFAQASPQEAAARAKAPQGNRTQQVAAAYDAKIAEATKSIDSLHKDVAGLEKQIVALKADAKKTLALLAEAEKQSGFSQADAKRHTNHLDAINKSIKSCTQDIAARQSQIASLDKLIAKLQKEKAEAIKKVQS